MKIGTGTALLAILLLASGCGFLPGGSDLDGTWTGTVVEDGQSTAVQVEIREKGNTIEGTFTILSETGEDIEKGMSFPILRTERSGDRFGFVVPLFEEEVNDDSLVFELVIDGRELKGFGHEMDSADDKLPITFTKQK